MSNVWCKGCGAYLKAPLIEHTGKCPFDPELARSVAGVIDLIRQIFGLGKKKETK